MVPTFLPGTELVVTSRRSAVVGEVVTLPHPTRDDFWLVKRVSGLPGDVVETSKGWVELGPSEAWVSSDNQSDGAVDSRTFGPVPVTSLMPMVIEFDEESFGDAVDLLVTEDEALCRVVETHGKPGFWRRPPGFATLVLLILEQQVSLESGAAVFRRLRDLVGRVTPANLLSVTPDEIGAIGATRQKAGYIVDMAAAIAEGELDLTALRDLPDEDASRRLQQIRGIGPWTAEAYLLSAEGRLDFFPVGDRALQVGTGEALAMGATPSPDELKMLSEPWRPVRSAAARILWHGYLSSRGRSEPDHDELDTHDIGPLV